jgi:hypothetical protein
MNLLNSLNLNVSSLRLTLAGLLATTLLLPTAASAAPVPAGTLVGTVTCGADEVTHAANIQVSIDGLPLSTHTDATGKFVLSNVPASRSFTINAIGSPDAFSVASRANVALQAGQTLDMGNLDLPVCPRPASDADEMTMEQRQDNRD